MLAPVDSFFFFAIAISKLIINFSSPSCIKQRAIANLSKSFLLIRSVLRDWKLKFAFPISFSEPRVGNQAFQLPCPCRLIQIRNWNQNLPSNLFQMRAWDLVTQLIPFSSFVCSHNQSKIHFPRFSAYHVINLYTSIFCIFLSAYPADEQLSIVAGGQNVSKPTNSCKKPRPNRKFC